MKSFFRLQIALALAAALLLTACTSRVGSSTGGTRANGQGFEGGELVMSYLESARARLVDTITRLHSDQSPTLCENGTGPDDEVVLKALITSLTTSQRAYCRTVIFAALGDLLALNAAPHPVAFSLTSDKLSITDPQGQAHEVSARTERGSAGPIVFDINKVRLLSPQALLALMFHEMMHKILIGAASFYDDFVAYPPFDSGLALLNTTGAAMALYAAATAPPPVITAADLPSIFKASGMSALDYVFRGGTLATGTWPAIAGEWRRQDGTTFSLRQMGREIVGTAMTGYRHYLWGLFDKPDGRVHGYLLRIGPEGCKTLFSGVEIWKEGAQVLITLAGNTTDCDLSAPYTETFRYDLLP